MKSKKRKQKKSKWICDDFNEICLPLNLHCCFCIKKTIVFELKYARNVVFQREKSETEKWGGPQREKGEEKTNVGIRYTNFELTIVFSIILLIEKIFSNKKTPVRW